MENMLEHTFPQGHESFAATVFWFQAFHYKYLQIWLQGMFLQFGHKTRGQRRILANKARWCSISFQRCWTGIRCSFRQKQQRPFFPHGCHLCSGHRLYFKDGRRRH